MAFSEKYCIGFLGADWWGSDARALSTELRHGGHMLVERHYEDYFPTRWRSFTLRTLRRLFRRAMEAEYNRAVEELLEIDHMDFLLVFKGMLLRRSALNRFKEKNVRCYCVYPDVSFLDHGKNIWDCLPLYDCLFTTKSFHLRDANLARRVRQTQYISHGFDPEVHRPIHLTTKSQKTYQSEAVFVGVWSPKKERILASLISELPSLQLAIWGPFWNRSGDKVRHLWKGRAAYGDELAAIYSGATINLGLLSEAGGGTSIGDQTTARTWQIPASGGFLLHEDTEEVRRSFEVNKQIAVFATVDELVANVRKYLSDDALREGIRLAGYQHCLASNYTYRNAATQVLDFHGKDAGVQ